MFVNIKIGLFSMVLILLFTTICLIQLGNDERTNWKPGQNIMTYFFIVWLLFYILEILNPNNVMAAWNINLTPYALTPLICAFVVPIVIRTKKDIELLLIDDGSTDNSFLICEKYKKRDNRIQLYTNKNVGQGLERNFGIKKSTGEYIAFLDSDDQYKKNMLEKLYQRAIETNADMVSCRIVDMHDGKIIKEHPLNDKVLIGCKEIKAAMADMISYEEKDGYSGCIAVWDSIFKRDIIENEGIQFFSERDVYSEDLLFKLMFMTHAKKIAFCTEAVYLYRVNDTSFTHRIDVSVLKRIVNLYNEVCILFGDVLKDYNLKRRIINRTFFTLRFNINKISKTRDAKDFYRILLNDQEIMRVIDLYQPTNLKNIVVYYSLKWKLIRVFEILSKIN